MAQLPTMDAYAPREMATRVEAAAEAKTQMTLLQTLLLAILAGFFIALGAMLFTLVMTGNPLGFGPARLLGGIAFSLGLVLVVVGGAELFTGNSLLVMAWADSRITLGALARNWSVVYIGNAIGAFDAVLLMALSGGLEIGPAEGAGVAETAAAIAAGKVALPWDQAFVRGILCNILVCLAVWLCFSARGVVDKILAIILPIAGFVALGFEHSIANLYLIPIGLYAGTLTGVEMDAAALSGFARNILWVTLGNIIGGGVFVAATYYLIYTNPAKSEPPAEEEDSKVDLYPGRRRHRDG